MAFENDGVPLYFKIQQQMIDRQHVISPIIDMMDRLGLYEGPEDDPTLYAKLAYKDLSKRLPAGQSPYYFIDVQTK